MMQNRIKLNAQPEALDIDLMQTGILVVDMQNAFLEKGGYCDLLGYDLARSRKSIEPTQKIVAAARRKSRPVIYLYIVHHPTDDGRGPESVFWHKEASLKLYRQNPGYKDKLLLPGSWGAQMIKELAPQENDALVEKPRYGGFFDTNLDTVLKRYSLRYLLVTGTLTNCCVESTIRESYVRGYFPIMISDATANSGPDFIQEATMFNVRSFFGWVTSSEDALKVLQ
jgi:ureidoacrylate peracid hydrolase